MEDGSSTCVVQRALAIANTCPRESPRLINSCLRVDILVFSCEEQNERLHYNRVITL